MTQTQTPDHETWQLAQWAREDKWALEAHVSELEAEKGAEDEGND